MSARTIFCRHCGALGAYRYGTDRRRRQRYYCPSCTRISTQRTGTTKRYSKLTETQWRTALRLFATRGGCSGTDLGRILEVNRKTGQRLNRCFRTATVQLIPKTLPGVVEWDETVCSEQWVLGGVSRSHKQCILRPIPNRQEVTLRPAVYAVMQPDQLALTDEWGGYNGLKRHLTVCHAHEFVASYCPRIHTNTQEGIWGHTKPLAWHVYRGFPRRTLSEFLAEVMFRYNIRSYTVRSAVLDALLSRKTNALLV